MTGVCVQIRLDSSRLPNKALLPLAGEPMCLHVMRALHHIEADVYALLTEAGSAEKLEPLARAAGFELFVGSKHDVLDRFLRAAEAFRLDRVVRATGDNPLVSYELANMLLAEHERVCADYSGYCGIAVGAGVEVVETKALGRAAAESRTGYDHEHVCPYLYGNPERFWIHRPLPPPAYRSRARITVDTAADYEAMQALFARLYRGRPPTHAEVLTCLSDLR